MKRRLTAGLLLPGTAGLALVCPYGAPRIDTDSGKVSKCTMCVHRQDAGLVPACATACLTGAIQFVEDFTGDTETTPDGFNDPTLTNPNIDFVLAG